MHSRRSVRNRALVAAASSTALLVGGAFTPLANSASGAVTSPGVTIETWPELDFVAASGYKPGTDVTVRVFRGTTKIGEATQAVVLDAKAGTGIAEINHIGNDPGEGPSDCWDAPHTPDIRPGDEVVVTGILFNGTASAQDTSVVRDVKLSNTVRGSGTLTFNGWVRSSAGAPVNAAADTLELRVEPYGTRENLTPADLGTGGSYSYVMSTPGITEADVEEAFLEWANAGGEEGEASEITVSTYPEADPVEMGCPPHGGPVDPGPGGAELAASPNALDFGNVQRGTTSAVKTVTVTNSGDAPASGLVTTVSGSGFSEVSTSTCGAALSARTSCTVDVTVTPGSTGAHNGTLTVAHDRAGTTPITVSLAANGVPSDPAPSASLTASPNALAFGSLQQGSTSDTKTFEVTNTGNATATNLAFSDPGPNFSRVSTSTPCGATLRAGDSCTVGVKATPTRTGAISGHVTVTSSAPTVTVSLSATGTAAPPQVGEITVLKNRLQFGLVKVGRFTQRSVGVRNDGRNNLAVTGVSVSTGSGFSLRHENCGTLAPAATCRIVVRFTGTAPTGRKLGTLSITSDDADERTSTVALIGRVRR